MNNQILLILMLDILQGRCQQVTVTQSPELLILRVGQFVNMSCHQNNKDHYVAIWYQQKPGQALQLMVYSADPSTRDMEATYTSWEIQRPSNLQSSLHKTGAEDQDSAVYFCASSRHSCKHKSNRLHKTCRDCYHQAAPSGCRTVHVEQNEKLLIGKVEDKLELKCKQDKSDYLNMFWYEKKPQQGLKLMVHSLNAKSTDMEADYKKGWSIERPDVYNSTLTLTSATKEDSAMYLCASSIHSLRVLRPAW